MPAPRKIDLLPPEIRNWLREELKSRAFSQYEEIAEALNFRLEQEGLEVRVQKSAIHDYGSKFRELARMQEEAQAEIKAFLEEASLKDEVDATRGLFQGLTLIQWKLQLSMADPDKLPDPRGMKDLTTALNNLIRSTSLRDNILKADRKERLERLDAAVEAGEVTDDFRQQAREIMGFA